MWILLKQETVSGSGISWAVCKSAPRSKQITTPAPHHSVFYRPDALPAAQPTASNMYLKLPFHWRGGSGFHLTGWFTGPTRVHNQNSISIGSAQFMVVTNRQTDRPRYIGSNRPHLMPPAVTLSNDWCMSWCEWCNYMVLSAPG